MVRVIAEAGVNHDGDRDVARKLVDAAVAAGAWAVKFQSFRTEALVTPDAPKAEYQKRDEEDSQEAMLRRLELSTAAHEEIAGHCLARGILFLSTPFDRESAELLDRLGVPLFKISSGDVTNHPFLAFLASKKRPVILSTGMSTLEEVRAAVDVLRRNGTQDLTLLHCVSDYPADPADMNLGAMATLRKEFGVPVGLSDHTLGIEVALAAVALGATVIEKHFTLDRARRGPDHAASLEPRELAALVRGVGIVEKALGDGVKRPTPREIPIRAVARRSIVAARDLRAGTVVRWEDLAFKRPGAGISPADAERVVGRRVARDLARDERLSWEALQ